MPAKIVPTCCQILDPLAFCKADVDRLDLRTTFAESCNSRSFDQFIAITDILLQQSACAHHDYEADSGYQLASKEPLQPRPWPCLPVHGQCMVRLIGAESTVHIFCRELQALPEDILTRNVLPVQWHTPQLSSAGSISWPHNTPAVAGYTSSASFPSMNWISDARAQSW